MENVYTDSRPAARSPHGLRETTPSPEVVRLLIEQSMLARANAQAQKLSGQAMLWQRGFGLPRPESAVQRASVWFTAYPAATIGGPDSCLRTLADPSLWEILSHVGIQAIHLGPTKRSGSIAVDESQSPPWVYGPTVDGLFDRISNDLDPDLGSDQEFQELVRAAGAVGALVIDDVIPGHTGMGPDFQLALWAVGEYPGIYHMIDIPEASWGLLPEVPAGTTAVNLSVEQEAALSAENLIIGELPRVIFFEPGVKETNWSATGPIKGVDGVVRRWVYLHYFKQGQPTLNWLDPTMAGPRLIMGDAIDSIVCRGAAGLRFDANGFLGIERGEVGEPAWSQDHPTSSAANHLLSSLVRKVGGFSFQEFNGAIDAIARSQGDGPDLSYDFISRPAYHHALLTGDVEFLRLVLSLQLDLGVSDQALVHALQNHDELTTELVHFWKAHPDQVFMFRGNQLQGHELAELVRGEIQECTLGLSSLNSRFSQNGIACTTVSAIAATLGARQLSDITPELVSRIRQAHLAMVAFNAFRPGIVALSGWDLVGAMTLDSEQVSELIGDGDTRWRNRGAYDLMGNHPDVMGGPTGVPRAQSLYGNLAQQRLDPDSFLNSVHAILAVRSRLRLAESTLVGIAATDQKGVLATVLQLVDGTRAVSAVNFGPDQAVTMVEHPELGEPLELVLDGWAADVIRVPSQY